MSYRSATIDLGRPPFARDGWHTFNLHYHDFEGLSTKKNKAVTLKLDFLGHNWKFKLYPGGCGDVIDGMMSVYLVLDDDEQDEDIRPIFLTCEVNILDCDGDALGNFRSGVLRFDGYDRLHGDRNFFHRSLVLDPSSDILVNGALEVEVKVKRRVKTSLPCEPFIPPIVCENKMQDLWYQDVKYKDVLFHIQPESGEDDGEQSEFYAHRAVLQVCAPGLFELCEPYGKDTPVPLPGVRSSIFYLLLGYVYGVSISVADWKRDAKELLEAADRYGMSDLKLEAEAWYVHFTEISTTNVFDLLAYAQAKTCELLKESLMDFIVQNRRDVLRSVSIEAYPGSQSLFTSILVSVDNEFGDRDVDSDDYHLMRISRLRRELDDLGLDVDGSRETLIKRLEAEAESDGSDDEGADESQDDDVGENEDEEEEA